MVKELKKNFIEIQPGDVTATHADISDFQTNFNYKPDTSIDFGISKFIDWYKDYYGENQFARK